MASWKKSIVLVCGLLGACSNGVAEEQSAADQGLVIFQSRGDLPIGSSTPLYRVSESRRSVWTFSLDENTRLAFGALGQGQDALDAQAGNNIDTELAFYRSEGGRWVEITDALGEAISQDQEDGSGDAQSLYASFYGELPAGDYRLVAYAGLDASVFVSSRIVSEENLAVEEPSAYFGNGYLELSSCFYRGTQDFPEGCERAFARSLAGADSLEIQASDVAAAIAHLSEQGSSAERNASEEQWISLGQLLAHQAGQPAHDAEMALERLHNELSKPGVARSLSSYAIEDEELGAAYQVYVLREETADGSKIVAGRIFELEGKALADLRSISFGEDGDAMILTAQPLPKL